VSDDAAAKSETILLRVFCTAGQKIILLLNGYDKGQDDSARRQQREIEKARKLLREFRVRKNGPSYVVGHILEGPYETGHASGVEAGHGHELQGLPRTVQEG